MEAKRDWVKYILTQDTLGVLDSFTLKEEKRKTVNICVTEQLPTVYDLEN